MRKTDKFQFISWTRILLLASLRGRRKKGKGKGDSCEARKASLALKRAPDFPYSLSPSTIGHVRYVSPRREGTTPSRGRVVAGWNFGANLESASSFSFWSLFDILFRKWYWPVQSLFISFASMETVKSSLKAKRKMAQGIFDVS